MPDNLLQEQALLQLHISSLEDANDAQNQVRFIDSFVGVIMHYI
jgi:hypothetical protein